MRGEHAPACTLPAVTLGSSPHARGTPTLSTWPHTSHGIIPACAGNTSRSAVSRALRRDHPRMRGEHRIPTRIRLTPLGSSPHARGTRPRARSAGRPGGIIPACAGNTARPAPGRVRRGDHPRMRGEHLDVLFEFRALQGSSPHARGTPIFIFRKTVKIGIIPACAGNTVNVPNTTPYPRGSSPHARGTPTADLQRCYSSGIIPACAGNTRSAIL